MRINKTGFTIIELLAVISVLAIISLIAVPQMLNFVEESRKDTFKLTAKLIADRAESIYIRNQTKGIKDEVTCNQVTELSENDFESCRITFDRDGFAMVSIVGKGKYDGMYVVDATKTSAIVINDALEIPLKFGRLYSDTVEYNDENITVYFIFYEDGSARVFYGEWASYPADTLIYKENKIESLELQIAATVSNDGNSVQAIFQGMEVNLEVDNYLINFGMPYKSTIEVDGETYTSIYTFYADGSIAALMDGELAYIEPGYFIHSEDKIETIDGQLIATISNNGKTIQLIMGDETQELTLADSRIYFQAPYTGVLKEGDDTTKISIIIYKSGLCKLLENNKVIETLPVFNFGDYVFLADAISAEVSEDGLELSSELGVFSIAD